MHRRLVLTLAAVALVASACGGDESVDSIATLKSTTTTAAPVTTEATSLPEISEEQALELAQCMRDQGLDFPDPKLDSDGNLTMDDLDLGRFGSTPDEIRANLERALDACSEYLEGVTFGGGQLPDLVQLQDTFLEFANCMRDNGYDLPDPDFTADGFGGLFEMGENIDPNDPAFVEAMGQCQSIFTELQP